LETSPTQDRAIVVEQLKAWYGDQLAVTDVNLTIQPNHVTAFIGPSGCGKSTFLRTLNRMHELVPGGRVEGKVVVDGQDIYTRDVDPVAVRRHIGMVFQRPNPFPTMSIFDNVIAGLRLTGLRDRRKLQSVVERSLTQAALWEEVKDRLNSSPLALSGGQQQRLCIARALAVEPEVILMDEPASALDPISTQQIEDTIAELKKTYTVVIVTHNLQEAARISDFTGFFLIQQQGDPGRLWEFGPTTRLFSTPKRAETERYITGRFG
jgi:phosphate transport system ATP-binding protein